LALFVVICDAAPVGDVIEEGPDLLELGFGHSQITQAAKHLGAVSKVSPVGHLDKQCSILRGQLLPLSLAIALSKSLQRGKCRGVVSQYSKPGMQI
jgi:hypothetical protein